MFADPQNFNGIVAAVIGIYGVLYLFTAAAFMIPTGFIAKKAGLSPWLCLLCLFPLTGLILLYVLAFIEWNVVPSQQRSLPSGYPAQPPYPPNPPFPPQA